MADLRKSSKSGNLDSATGPIFRGPGSDGIIRKWVYDREAWCWRLVELNSTVEEELARERAREELREAERERVRKFQKYQRRATNGQPALRRSQSEACAQRWKLYALDEQAACEISHKEMLAEDSRRHLPLIADVEERRLQLQRRREKDLETQKLLAKAEERRMRREAKEAKERADKERLELWARAEKGKKHQEANMKANEERKLARERAKAEELERQQGAAGAKIVGASHDWLGPPRNCTYLWTSGDGELRSSTEPPPVRVRKRSSTSTPIHQPPGGPSFYSPPEGDKPVEPQWAV